MRRRSPLPWPVRSLLVGAVVLALPLAACGDDDDDAGSTDEASSSTESSTTTSTSAAPAEDGAEAGSATIEAKDFSLTSITVAAGAEVEVVNDGAAPHTVTGDDGLFDSGTVSGGATATFTAPTEPGEHAFHCEIHPSMTGTLTVEG